ncbi:hypothetical protein OROGR_017413 [Orobanche gracilis]
MIWFCMFITSYPHQIAITSINTHMAGAVILVMVRPCLVMMICLAIITHAEGALSCVTVLSNLSPCLGYLRGGGSVTPSCCDGLKSVNNAAGTTPDLRAACHCIKTLIPSTGSNPDYVNSLPGICHVNIPYKYSPSLDCSKLSR